MTTPEQLLAAIRAKKPGFQAKIGIILGSGLGEIADKITDATIIDYAELPGFPVSTVVGHTGRLYLGYLNGIPLACLQGRVHYYEGIDYEKMRILVRTLKLIGCDTLIVTNAAGSLRENVGVGEIVAITDHINFQGHNPLVGANDDYYGERFHSMENAYDAKLREQLHQAAKTAKITLQDGVYMAVLGPSFETPAEIRAYRLLGADLIGMSTVSDVIIARHCGLKVIGISAVTNLAAGMSVEPISHTMTLEGAALAARKISALILEFISQQLLLSAQ